MQLVILWHWRRVYSTNALKEGTGTPHWLEQPVRVLRVVVYASSSVDLGSLAGRMPNGSERIRTASACST